MTYHNVYSAKMTGGAENGGPVAGGARLPPIHVSGGPTENKSHLRAVGVDDRYARTGIWMVSEDVEGVWEPVGLYWKFENAAAEVASFEVAGAGAGAGGPLVGMLEEVGGGVWMDRRLPGWRIERWEFEDS